MKSREVLLCSTLHDPRGVFADYLPKISETVLQGYRGWVVNTTTSTDQRSKNILSGLASIGVYATETDVHHPIASDPIENDHIYVLKQAAAIAQTEGIRKIQYTDGDRIIMAAKYFSGDLHQLSERASELLTESLSYVNFRRDVTSFFSHHPPLVQTEAELIRFYSVAFGIPIDICSTAHAMSLDVLEEVLRRSPLMEAVSFPQPKWLLIAKEMGATIQSEETEHVLTFETPDQYMEKTKEQTYEMVQQNYMATLGLSSTVSPKEWDLRFNTQRQYLTLLRDHINIFGFDEERANKLHAEIDRTLVSMEGFHNAISVALNTPEADIQKMIHERREHVLSQ